MKFVLPSRKQPKILQAFKVSFETLSRHIYLLIPPILVDLFFLFGTRLLISDEIQNWLNAVTLPSTVSPDVVKSWTDLSGQFLELVSNFSLTGFLRSYPIGIPSLLAFRGLAENPTGLFSTIQVQNPGQIFFLILLFSILGFVFGALFLIWIGTTVQDRSLKQGLQDLHRKIANLCLIPILSIAGFLVIFIPAVMIIAVVANLMPILGSIGYFILSLILISTLTPYFFTPHEIILFNRTFKMATKESRNTVRPTNAKTSIFLLLLFLFTYATNLLWQIAKDDSWIMLVSILGHALVTTLMFVASFHYYIDARQSVLDSKSPKAELAQPRI